MSLKQQLVGYILVLIGCIIGVFWLLYVEGLVYIMVLPICITTINIAVILYWLNKK